MNAFPKIRVFCNTNQFNGLNANQLIFQVAWPEIVETYNRYPDFLSVVAGEECSMFERIHNSEVIIPNETRITTMLNVILYGGLKYILWFKIKGEWDMSICLRENNQKLMRAVKNSPYSQFIEPLKLLRKYLSFFKISTDACIRVSTHKRPFSLTLPFFASVDDLERIIVQGQGGAIPGDLTFTFPPGDLVLDMKPPFVLGIRMSTFVQGTVETVTYTIIVSPNLSIIVSIEKNLGNLTSVDLLSPGFPQGTVINYSYIEDVLVVTFPIEYVRSEYEVTITGATATGILTQYYTTYMTLTNSAPSIMGLYNSSAFKSPTIRVEAFTETFLGRNLNSARFTEESVCEVSCNETINTTHSTIKIPLKFNYLVSGEGHSLVEKCTFIFNANKPVVNAKSAYQFMIRIVAYGMLRYYLWARITGKYDIDILLKSRREEFYTALADSEYKSYMSVFALPELYGYGKYFVKC